jgi:hypothetical protein
VHLSERWTIGLTAAIAFFGLCTVVAAFLQWDAMRGQLREMKGGAVDTHNLATAAIDQASAAKTQAEQAKAQTDKLAASVTEMQKQSSAMRESADASIAANRAWMLPVPLSATQVEPGDRPINLHWLNAGKSPAVNIYATAEYEIGSPTVRTFKLSEGCAYLKRRLNGLKNTQWEKKMSLLVPGDRFDLELANTPTEWTAAPTTGNNALVAHGCIWYTDVLSNRERTTEFCYEASRVPLQGKPEFTVYPCWFIRSKPLSFQ